MFLNNRYLLFNNNLSYLVDNDNITINPRNGDNINHRTALSFASEYVVGGALITNYNADGSIDITIQATFKLGQIENAAWVAQVFEVGPNTNLTNESLVISEEVIDAFIIPLDKRGENVRFVLFYIVNGTSVQHAITTISTSIDPSQKFFTQDGLPTGDVSHAFIISTADLNKNNITAHFPNGVGPGSKQTSSIFIHEKT